jgi:hypothetical protein
MAHYCKQKIVLSSIPINFPNKKPGTMAGLPSFITLHMRVVLALSARVFVVVDIHMLAQPAGLLQFKVILHLPTPYFIQKL